MFIKNHWSEKIVPHIVFGYRLILRICFYLLSAVLFIFLFGGSLIQTIGFYEDRNYDYIPWMVIPFLMSGAFLYVLLNGHKLPLKISSMRFHGAANLRTQELYYFEDFHYLIDSISKQNNEGSFLVFMFNVPNQQKELNIQLSVENKKLGIDWILLGDANIEDEQLFKDTVESFGYQYLEIKKARLKYIRVEDVNDLVKLTKDILVEMYKVGDETVFNIIAEGFTIKE